MPRNAAPDPGLHLLLTECSIEISVLSNWQRQNHHLRKEWTSAHQWCVCVCVCVCVWRKGLVKIMYGPNRVAVKTHNMRFNSNTVRPVRYYLIRLLYKK